VPYDNVWRAGANEATTISFSHPISIGDTEIEAGRYGLFMIPEKDIWTVILNKDWQQWGAYNYKAEDDVFRTEIKALTSSHTELCTYSFVDVTKESGVLRMQWENVLIDIKIRTATNGQTLKEIELVLNKVKENWYSFSAAAQYQFYELKDADKALEYIDVAIALDAPNPAPWMLKSQILASQMKFGEAIKLAQKAIEVCRTHNFAFEIHENEENIQKWKNN
jgi:tetratricopeptide (TPR) repeat protein